MYCAVCVSTDFRDLFALAACMSHCLCPASMCTLCQSHKGQSVFLASPAYLLTVSFWGRSATVRSPSIYSYWNLCFCFYFLPLKGVLRVNLFSTHLPLSPSSSGWVCLLCKIQDFPGLYHLWFLAAEGLFLLSPQPGLPMICSVVLPHIGWVKAFEVYQCECYVPLLFRGPL